MRRRGPGATLLLPLLGLVLLGFVLLGFVLGTASPLAAQEEDPASDVEDPAADPMAPPEEPPPQAAPAPPPYAPGGQPPPGTVPHAPPGYGGAPGQPYAQPYGVQPYGQPGLQPPEAMGYPEPEPPPRRRVRVEYEEGMEVPEGGEVISRSRLGLFLPGIIIFGVTYLSTVALIPVVQDERALDGEDPDDANILYAPFVGPFLYMQDALDDWAKIPLALDGVLQTAGVILFITGITTKRRYLVYEMDREAEPPLTLRPTFGPTMSGLSVTF